MSRAVVSCVCVCAFLVVENLWEQDGDAVVMQLDTDRHHMGYNTQVYRK